MLTKGAIGNLVNRYRAVLKKCNLINTFGSLAVASMLVMGGVGVASAENVAVNSTHTTLSATQDDKILTAGGDISSLPSASNPTWIRPAYMGSLTVDGYDSIIYNGSNFQPTSGYYESVFYTNGTGANLTIQNTGDISSNISSNQNNKVLFFNAQGGNINVNAKSIYVENVTSAVRLEVSGAKEGATVTLNAENIKLSGGRAIDVYDKHLNQDSTLNANSGIAKLNINATNSLELIGTGDYAILAREDANHEINVNGKEVFIKGENAVYAYNGAKINIGQNSETVHIEGNILSYSGDDKKSDIAIDLGENGSLAGTVQDYSSSSSNSEIALNVGNGSNWNATGDSSVTNLDLDGGSVNIPAGVDIAAANATGNGNINMEDAAELGSFSAADGDAAVNVQATDADGKVKNADEVSADTLKKMKAKVTGLDNVTASAAEGDVNGALTVDASGNAKQARNTLMDAALQQASVTSIALDKLLTNDVRKRLGDIRADKNQTGVWMRWDGGKLQGEGLSNDFNTIQIGGDTKVGKNCRLGVAGSFTHGDAEFARGTAELEGFSFAGYATWMGENGMFADIVARIGHFSNEMKVEGREGDMNNRVASLSGEYGWRFNVCDQFFVEPQVELAYTYVSSDDLQLGTAHYEFDSVDSLTGRAGLVAGWNLPNDMGNLYARASVVQQFMGDAKISGSNGSAHNIQELDGEDTWLEYGIGANIKLTDKTYIWADVERTEGADIDEEWRGTVGIRVSF